MSNDNKRVVGMLVMFVSLMAWSGYGEAQEQEAMVQYCQEQAYKNAPADNADVSMCAKYGVELAR